MNRLSFCRSVLVCILTIVWCVIAHVHQVSALTPAEQNRSLSSTEPTTEQIAQTSADNSWQTELTNSVRQPSPYKPTVVFVYVRLNTVSQINLPDKTYNISAEIVLEWQDGRLAFTPTSAPLKFNGKDVDLVLGRIWSPSFTIGNEIQPRETQNRSVQVAPNGWVRVYEQFNDVVKFDADVHAFPFSNQTLTLAINSALDDLSAVRFSVQEFKFNSPDPSQQIIGRWSLNHLDASTKSFNRLDSKLGFPQTLISMQIQHKPQYIIFNFFVPLFIIFVAAAAVTWIDPTQTAPHTAPRVLGTIILILTTITLKFALAREIPAVSYITLTDAVFGMTVLLLIVSLIMSCAIIFSKEYMHKDLLSKKLNISFRKLYPLLYLACMSTVFLIFYATNWNS
ncbi:hypothetical protein H6F89_31710 [Cyanobacteria bacterium FACHB-63]|nr:hypothetical protein [Cyanobacteria bacterium FACHB-63]